MLLNSSINFIKIYSYKSQLLLLIFDQFEDLIPYLESLHSKIFVALNSAKNILFPICVFLKGSPKYANQSLVQSFNLVVNLWSGYQSSEKLDLLGNLLLPKYLCPMESMSISLNNLSLIICTSSDFFVCAPLNLWYTEHSSTIYFVLLYSTPLLNLPETLFQMFSIPS
ncbi:hypothetical protein BB560_002268 [Smittium megazygosporum]|uniref:Uncharacterized protein n=1 Tax=Smittium megazygosporum TaxID=133381 RepID=A0A2T9ZF79_9FUNG|nr:hypothetical protein BB560_002268 [Smittium megazygosporum]